MRFGFLPVLQKTGLVVAAFFLLSVCTSETSKISAADRSSGSAATTDPFDLQGKLKGVDAATRASIEESYGKLPLGFEANKGQVADSVKFLARGDGYTLFLTSTEAVLALRGKRAEGKEAIPAGSSETAEFRPTAKDVIRLKPVGSNRNPKIAGLDTLPGTSNYFIGNEPAKCRTDVPQYAKVKIEDIYPGIDMVYYGNQRQLEYDWIVAPGADPKAIRFAVEGKGGLKIDSRGDIILDESGDVRLKKPFVYQESGGERTEVAGRYVLAGEQEIEFRLDAYNESLPLVIDPVLNYSVRFGGSDTEYGNAIAVDSSGNAYITGFTFSTDFPTANPYQLGNRGGYDAYVTKLNASGSALVYSTYLGGNGVDAGNGIAVDSFGNAYVTGYTTSANFPVANPYRGTFVGGGRDAFVTKLNASGNGLAYSTYLGGTGSDLANAIAVDSFGYAYVTGNTDSADFPVLNPLQANNAGNYDAFVTKITMSGSGLAYSTYLGGNSTDSGAKIAVDSSGSAYVAGDTFSANFPTANAYQANSGGGYDAFVAKLSPSGSNFFYSTYLGGSDWDRAHGIAIDSSGNAYVTGETQSPNFPTLNAYQTGKNGLYDAFVTKLNVSGTALVYSTYLGGNSGDYGYGIGVDSSGNAYVAGYTNSTDFPTLNAHQSSAGGSTDAFVLKLNASGNALFYSTYLGGSGVDSAYGIAVDSSGNAYVAGYTDSPNFPTANAYQSETANTFVIKIGLPAYSGITLGDVDGDGKADFVIWRPGEGAWYSLRSGSAGTYESTQWGLGTDIPVAGDYDGDGRMDLAVWRPETGVWYILPSNSPGTYVATLWGVSTDIPVPADYDGDGKTDIAFWRSAEGIFYVLPSSSPQTFTATHWGLPNDVPALGR